MMDYQYDYWKEELHRCNGCHEWIEHKIYRYRFNGKMLYFHPHCFRILGLRIDKENV